jgi:hypothetical protein
MVAAKNRCPNERFKVRRHNSRFGNSTDHELSYTYSVSKLRCTHRAEWQLTPGKSAKRLSSHYQLGCDYGTPLITIYKEGDGVEPIYLCESHATEVGRLSTNRAAVRPTETQATATNNRTKAEDRLKPAEVADAKPKGSARAETPASSTAAEPVPATTDPVMAATVRDLTYVYGNSAKALVDETIWNLATGDYGVYRTALQQGKSRSEAAEAAGGQLAIVNRKISEYTLKLEALLSASNAKISALEVINKPLEKAMLEIIDTGTMDDAAKDAVIEQLGLLQESLTRGLESQITVLQSQRIVFAIGERANWGVSADLPEELQAAYWVVWGHVRNAVLAAVPEAVNTLERLANLFVARAELENAPQAKLAHHPDRAECQSLHS